MTRAVEEARLTGQPLAEVVYELIRKDLRSGVIKPGERLLETALAERLEVSRTPIREAMQRLVADGVLVVGPARGMTVLELDKRQVHKIYALREVLEGAAAKLAARFATDEEIAVLRKFLEASDHIDDPAQFAELNRAFQDAIVDAAHNEYLKKALIQLSGPLALLPGTTFEVPGRIEAARREHMALLEAIYAHDEVLAEQLARDHIRQAQLARVSLMFEPALKKRGG